MNPSDRYYDILYVHIYIYIYTNSYCVIVLKISQVLWGTLLYPILIHSVPISCWSGHLLTYWTVGFMGGMNTWLHKRKVPRYTKVYVTWGFFNWIPKTVAFNTKMVDFWMIWGTPHDWRQLGEMTHPGGWGNPRKSRCSDAGGETWQGKTPRFLMVYPFLTRTSLAKFAPCFFFPAMFEKPEAKHQVNSLTSKFWLQNDLGWTVFSPISPDTRCFFEDSGHGLTTIQLIATCLVIPNAMHHDASEKPTVEHRKIHILTPLHWKVNVYNRIGCFSLRVNPCEPPHIVKRETTQNG